MILIGLLLSVALPLLAGVPWVSAIGGDRRPGTWPLALGYGYALGLVIVVLWMRVLDAVGVPASIMTVVIAPIVAAVIGLRRNRDALGHVRDALRQSRAGWKALGRPTRIVVTIILALIALRLLTLGSEILFRPIFPWEAVSAVAAKARVWFDLGRIAPFVTPQEMLAGAGDHTDADPGAFALPSLLLAYTAHLMMQWHEGAVAFHWWVLGVAMVLVIYGHLRHAGAGVAFAIAFAYVFISLPIVDLHIGLAGAPQWIAATGVGLSGCAMLRWLASRERWWLWLVAIGMTLALMSLLSTWPWFVLFAASAAIVRWPRHAKKIAIGLPLLVLFALLAWQQTPLSVGGTTLQLQVVPTWSETIESLFLLDNWHLLYGVAIVVALAARRLVLTERWLARTWLIATGVGLLFVWGTVAVQGLWFGGLRDFSYAALQFAPMLVLWTALVVRALAVGDAVQGDAARAQDERAPADMLTGSEVPPTPARAPVAAPSPASVTEPAPAPAIEPRP